MQDGNLLADLGKRRANWRAIKRHRLTRVSWQDERLRRQREELVQAVVEQRGPRSRFLGVSMQVCCAHHLTDVFAIIGLSGAALFLNLYKTPLLWLGIIMNLFGIAYLLWKIREQEQLVHAVDKQRG
jgi:hypothetical protein